MKVILEKIVFLFFLAILASGTDALSLCHVESLWTKLLRSLLIIPLFLYAILTKLAALLLGVFLLLLSLIPIPRLSQWCPPSIAIFDGILAVFFGIIFFVLILWAFAGEEDDADNENLDNSNMNRGMKKKKRETGQEKSKQFIETMDIKQDQLNETGKEAEERTHDADGVKGRIRI